MTRTTLVTSRRHALGGSGTPDGITDNATQRLREPTPDRSKACILPAWNGLICPRLCLLATSAMAFLASPGTAAPALAEATSRLGITVVAMPTVFTSGPNASCEEPQVFSRRCDAYDVLVRNLGALSSGSPITVEDELPAGTELEEHEEGTINGIEATVLGTEQHISEDCEATEAGRKIRCVYPDSLASGVALAIKLYVKVAVTGTPSLHNHASVSAGGTEEAVAVTTHTAPAGAPQPFGFANFSFGAYDATGTPDRLAADHPESVTTGFSLTTQAGTNGGLQLTEAPKDIVVDLPLGLVGNPQAAPRCNEAELIRTLQESGCPLASEIGALVLQEGEHFAGSAPPGVAGEEYVLPIYNMVPDEGYPAEFALAKFGKPVFMHASVIWTPSGYDLQVIAPGVPGATGADGAYLTFYGNPVQHTGQGVSAAAFFTNPSDCAAGPDAGSLKARIYADSYVKPGEWVTNGQITSGPIGASSHPLLDSGNWVQGTAERPAEEEPFAAGVTGCDALQFNPTLHVLPETAQADTPSGYEVDLRVPQANNIAPVLATPELKDATVTLPAGVSISPPSAEGLQGCSEAQIALSSTEPGTCPAGSDIGAVKVVTPLLADPLEGQIYLGQPLCGSISPCNEADAHEGRLFRLYLQVQGSGVVVKLPGTVSANTVNGQLTASFDENPQLPFSEVQLRFKSGPRAPLANPQTCGRYTTVSELEPWSSPQTPTALSESAFAITGCQGFPFNPAFSAGTVNPEGGAYSPFTLTFSRADGEQDLSQISVQTPPGLLGKIAGVPECGEAQANAGTCGPESQIGTTTVAAGAGAHPLYLTGRVYLTGPYAGQPFGLSIVVPAVAGPFNLGAVVVRSSIAINPTTAALTITSTPLPQIIDGVPIRLKTVNVAVNRPGFMFNPTNCAQQQITATITGAQGASAAVSSPFAVTGCAGLPFKPVFTASTGGSASKANGASLTVKIAQKPGEANIHKVNLQLPISLPSRLTTLQKACTEAQFNANPAGCPEGSFVGTATAHTPVLNAPLTGPAILVSHGGADFPDVEFVLQGEGVQIVLDGKTDIKKGRTYSNFETVPDTPITSFETILPVGPHSVLGAYVPGSNHYNFCGQSLTLPTTITAQNGAVVTQTTKLGVTGCPPSVAITKTAVKGNSVAVTVKLGQQGTVKITGRGLRTTTKRGLKAGTRVINVPLTAVGRAAKRHGGKLKVQAALTVAGKTGTATATLRA